MAYYPDLSPFMYQPGSSHALSVGWLSQDHPFPRGPVSLAFAHELRQMAAIPVELTRGYHLCEFCQPPRDIISADPRYEEVWALFRCGNGEIHVIGEYDEIYYAPTLIAHYVGEHQYQPPAEFIAAVLFQRRLRSSTRTAS